MSRWIVMTAAVSAAAAAEPEVVREWLRYGNERHAAGKYVHWHQSLERRREVASRERPHAAVLSCSDSRIPPELVFDQGIGDLFVVHVAGYVAGEKELASIECPVSKLEAPLVVVLGHERCPIVEAAVEGGELAGHMGSIIASLAAAADRAKALPGDAVERAARLHVEATVEQLRNSEPLLARLCRMGTLKVIGGLYNLDAGDVSWLREDKAAH